MKKIIKVSSDLTELVKPLLYNDKIDSYESLLDIYPFIDKEGDSFNKIQWKKVPETVKKSKKGFAVILVFVLLLLAFLPLWILLLLIGFVSNQIKYADKLK